MTSPYDTLKAAVQDWRSTAITATATSPNPHGKALHQLNLDWARVRAEHEKRIAADREKYLRARQDLIEKSRAHATANPKRPRGRIPRGDYDAAVKIAAYRAFTGRNRTEIRLAIGAADTATLDRVLAEGQALHEAGEAATGTDGGW